MRIGILADIHDAVVSLEAALTRFRELAVDQVVSLGDAFDTFRPGEPGVEVARLLKDAGTVGVWGNHDFGLSHDVQKVVRDQADPALLDFTSTLKPQVVLDDCRFSHLEPWLDPTVLEDLWFFDGVPDTSRHTDRCFAKLPERFLFLGHFHCWAVTTVLGRVEWNGERTLSLAKNRRHLIAVAPLVYGWSAVFDTEKAELTPIHVGQA